MIVVVGFLVAGAGWMLLLFGSDAGASLAGRSIVNIHMLSIAQGVINLGYALIIIGTVKEGFRRIEERLSGGVQSDDTSDDNMPASIPDDIRRAVLERNNVN